MKKIIAINIILILIILSITNVFASNSITKEALEKAIEKFNNAEEIKGEKIILDGDNIFVGTETQFSYNLDGNPTFTSKMTYTNGMTVENFKDESNNILNGCMGLPLIAIDKGIEAEDAMIYTISKIFMECTNLVEISNKISQLESYENFNAIEKAKEFFDESIIDECKLFDFKLQKKLSTESEYIVEAIFEVKIEEDFSEMKDSDENIADTVFNIMTNSILTSNQIEDNENTKEDLKVSINQLLENIGINEIPQTGKTYGKMQMLWGILFISILTLVLYIAYNRRIDGKE